MNSVLSERKLKDKKNLRRNLVAFLLVFMSIQYVPLEGPLISWPKIIVMTLSFFVLFLGNNMTGILFGGLYYLTICLTSALHPYPVSLSSILYVIPFIVVFGSFYSLLHSGDFSLEDFEKLIEGVLWSFIICLLLQQLCWLVGWSTPLIFNRWKPLGFKFQSLALEPSYAARITGAYMLAFLEIQRLKTGKRLSVNKLWKEHRKLFLGCIYMLMTLGSGTAWGVIVILGAYFTCYSNPLLAVAGICALFFLPSENMEAQERLVNVVQATSTLDINNVRNVDPSASVRIGSFFAFVQGFKPFTSIFWIGQGHYRWIAPNIGIIMIYGFVAWIMQMILFRICAFRSFCSFEYAYFFIFCVIGIGNVVNHWAIVMVFVTLKYFYQTYKTTANEKNPIHSK